MESRDVLGIIKDAQNGPILINQKGEVTFLSLNDNESPSFKEIQDLVKGIPQVMRLAKYKLPELCMICNQEGKMQLFNTNLKASTIWNLYFAGPDRLGNEVSESIVGDVIIAPSSWLTT